MSYEELFWITLCAFVSGLPWMFLRGIAFAQRRSLEAGGSDAA